MDFYLKIEADVTFFLQRFTFNLRLRLAQLDNCIHILTNTILEVGQAS